MDLDLTHELFPPPLNSPTHGLINLNEYLCAAGVFLCDLACTCSPPCCMIFTQYEEIVWAVSSYSDFMFRPGYG